MLAQFIKGGISMTLALWSIDGPIIQESRDTKGAKFARNPIDMCERSQLGTQESLYKLSEYELPGKEPGHQVQIARNDFNAYREGEKRIRVNLWVPGAKLLEVGSAYFFQDVRSNDSRVDSPHIIREFLRDPKETISRRAALAPRTRMVRWGSCPGKR
jgi:hypothetical protein